MKTLLVTDQVEFWHFATDFTDVVEAGDYLTNELYIKQRAIRVVNLCRSYKYQSMGYYVSLLAQARGHKTLPSALSIQDLTNSSLSATLFENLIDETQKALKHISSDEFQLSIYFGRNIAKCYDDFCKKIHQLFPAPLLRIDFVRKNKWTMKKIRLIASDNIPSSHLEFVRESTECFFNKKYFRIGKKKETVFDLAILVNPEESTPPSNARALNKFSEVGKSLGINVDLIERRDFNRLLEYDGLFIRETTSVNHYTYLFSRRAAAQGLIVIDDPESILKCANKVYLYELMTKSRVRVVKTLVLHRKNWKSALPEIGFPCILKLPDSAFSKGVIKVENEESYHDKVKEFLTISDLIIAQVFMPTEFDWRIGIFNNQFLFACRYYMAKNHWQIYNWDKVKDSEGAFDVVDHSNVPQSVLDIALSACRTIGNGLYGVDIKEYDGKAYIIEVNDNPNIDAGIEDKLLHDELYSKILQGFLDRFKQLKGLT